MSSARPGRNVALPFMTPQPPRVAHLISMDPTRGDLAKARLAAAGFTPRHVHPVPTSDPRIERLANMSRLDLSRSAATFSLALTHADLWSTNHNSEWLYVFEDDVTFPAEWLDVQCALDAAEALSSGKRNSFIFLGACLPDYTEWSKRVRTKETHLQGCRRCERAAACEANASDAHKGGNVTDAAMKKTEPLFLRRCAPLCTHAYAVRKSAGLWAFMREALYHTTTRVRGPPTAEAIEKAHKAALLAKVREKSKATCS